MKVKLIDPEYLRLYIRSQKTPFELFYGMEVDILWQDEDKDSYEVKHETWECGWFINKSQFEIIEEEKVND
jgi:hypothetical protein